MSEPKADQDPVPTLDEAEVAAYLQANPDFLQRHPAVLEAAVTGVPHDRWGEVGIAWVVVRGDVAPDAEALLDLCRERLARYKVPRDVRFVDALPRSAMNKVLKADLTARYRQEAS